MQIGNQLITSGGQPYVIAELSANHGGSKAAAIEAVIAAAEAGADAVKLQHYTPETITTRSSHRDFEIHGGTVWDGRWLADLYTEAMTPWEWTGDIATQAERVGIAWFSSPFDPSAVDFLAEFDIPAYKIASFEIVDLPLIRYAASKGRPVIISTGMASVAEIDSAVQAAADGGAPSVALLRCNSGYPARAEEMDLRAIPAMAQMWQVPIGLSDHTLGEAAAIVGVALGACIIEKHLILDRRHGGPDAQFSANPAEFARLVSVVREAHQALGAVRFGPSAREMASRSLRRSLRATRPIAAGEAITAENVRSIRPAGGLSPDDMVNVNGMIANQDLKQGAPITWEAVRPIISE